MHQYLPIPSLADYGLSADLGFLPSETPLDRLPDDFYAPWEDLVSDIPLLHHDDLQARIERLPVLDVSHLRNLREWRRAYVCLSFLLHGYMWGGEPRTVSASIKHHYYQIVSKNPSTSPPASRSPSSTSASISNSPPSPPSPASASGTTVPSTATHP